MSVEHHWIYTTWPDMETARSAARLLVEERLCGCANILPGIESVYQWEGKVESAREIAVVFKAPANNSARLNARITELHPYTTPCILALPVDRSASAPGFLAWLEEQASCESP